ncbi:MAG: Jag N-terminal domain-containing protein [Candidatus Electrothrix sp. GW3-4]|uniref:Jag family protein n=1 Tax=Candidatus Electrothrix sp. GW3-4 TaxID=3126740 RepID=UPI0030CB5A11
MVQGKDFYGGTVTDAIAEACQEFSTSQEGLDIEILETGSSGIFGLCRKKAHIRVTKKEEGGSSGKEPGVTEQAVQGRRRTESGKKASAPKADDVPGQDSETSQISQESAPRNGARKNSKKTAPRTERRADAELPPPELPTDEVLAEIQEDITAMLRIMGFPSTVTVTLENYTVACHISDDYEEELVGREGRTLDSLQYLLRKITSRRLPERIMFSLDVGTYRERRAEELKELALELAARVREEGKTQAIPALNPSERRVVHMVLQDDKTIRSRSVGAGLFKKVLIYKPGRKKNYARKGKGKKGQQTDRASDS